MTESELTPVTTEPAFEYDAAVDADRQERIDRLLENIRQHPAAFKLVLESDYPLFDDAAPAIQTGEAVVQQAAASLWDYFNRKDDSAVGYDDATENAIADSPDYRRLVKERRDWNANHRGTNQEKFLSPVDNKVRQYRLAVFVTRAAIWQKQQSARRGSRVA